MRARIVAKLPGAQPSDVAVSPIPGLYEVTMGGLIAYVSSDGKYLLSGNVYDLDTQENLTATRRNSARAKALATASESNMIVFGPANAKMTVTVFTDIDCGFCRKFHTQIADVNKAGVRVRYMFFPRTGPGTESWTKAAGLACHRSPRSAHAREEGRAVKAQELRRRGGQVAVRTGLGPRRGRDARDLHAERGLYRRLPDAGRTGPGDPGIAEDGGRCPLTSAVRAGLSARGNPACRDDDPTPWHPRARPSFR